MRTPILIAIVVLGASAMVAWNLQPVQLEVAANPPAAETSPIVEPDVIEPKATVTVAQKISATMPEDAPKAEPQKKNPFRMRQKVDEDTPIKPEPVEEPKPVLEADTPAPTPQIVSKKLPALESDYDANEALAAGEKLYNAEKHDQAETQLLSALNYWKKQSEPDHIKLANTAHWLGRNQYQEGAGNPLAGANWLKQSLEYEDRIVPARPATYAKGPSLFELGKCYVELQSREKAEECFLAAKRIFEGGNNDARVVNCFDHLRSLYIATGQTSQSQSCTNAIRRLVPEKLSGNIAFQRRLLQIEYLECLSVKKYRQAREYLQQRGAYDNDTGTSTLTNQADLAEDFADLHFAMNEPDVALKYFETAIRHWESHHSENPENPTLGGIYHNFGHKLIEHKKYERGHEYLLRALKIWDKPHCSCHL